MTLPSSRRSCLPALLALLVTPAAYGDDLPQVAVTNVRRVFHNGEHNAFTDLVRFRDRFYLTFRSCPDGHMVHPTASIIVLASDDAKAWRQVHRFHVEKRDTRDPHFLVFDDRLFVYTGTWYSGESTLPLDEYDLNKHLGYAVWSEDGVQWSEPILLEGTFGHYIWRANSFGGKAFLCGRRKKDFEIGPRGEGRTVQSAMLESDDGLVWRFRTLFQEDRGDETAFQFEPDGTIVAVGRRGRDNAQLLRSKPPYTHWDRQDLDRYIGGPLLVRWGGRYVVGGRKTIGDAGPKTAMYWLVDGELHQFAELPSGGDTSYPGFVELDATHAIMSWYSSHEKDDVGKTITAIYMADLEIVNQGRHSAIPADLVPPARPRARRFRTVRAGARPSRGSLRRQFMSVRSQSRRSRWECERIALDPTVMASIPEESPPGRLLATIGTVQTTPVFTEHGSLTELSIRRSNE